jgi:dolichol kinase
MSAADRDKLNFHHKKAKKQFRFIYHLNGNLACRQLFCTFQKREIFFGKILFFLLHKKIPMLIVFPSAAIRVLAKIANKFLGWNLRNPESLPRQTLKSYA